MGVVDLPFEGHEDGMFFPEVVDNVSNIDGVGVGGDANLHALGLVGVLILEYEGFGKGARLELNHYLDKYKYKAA